MTRQPEECSNIQEVRAAIDSIDHQIIAAIGQRFKYVKAAAKFKHSETDVQAPDRLKSMLQERRVWAKGEGLDPDVIENLYQDLVNYFIAEELKYWQSKDSLKSE